MAIDDKDTPQETNKALGFERSQIPLIGLMLTLFMLVFAMFGWLKLDNNTLRSDVNAMRSERKADNIALRTEFRSDMNALRSELKADNEALRSELKADINALRTELNTKIDRIESDISVLKTDVALIKARMDALEARVTSVENRVANIENRVTNIETQLAANGDMRREYEALRARVEILESRSQSG